MSDLTQKVSLGRTGVKVSRLGIGSAYGVSERACRMAFSAPIPGPWRAVHSLCTTM